MTLFIKKLNKEATIPTYGSEGAACFDLSSDKDVKWTEVHVNDNITRVGKQIAWQVVVPTGLAFEIQQGYRMDIYPRSGWGFKYNIQLANGTGKIDSDYRGEVMVKLLAFCKKEELPGTSDEMGNIILEAKSRIAQAEINKVFQAEFKEVDTLSDTERGEGGFGSTGHK